MKCLCSKSMTFWVRCQILSFYYLLTLHLMLHHSVLCRTVETQVDCVCVCVNILLCCLPAQDAAKTRHVRRKAPSEKSPDHHTWQSCQGELVKLQQAYMEVIARWSDFRPQTWWFVDPKEECCGLFDTWSLRWLVAKQTTTFLPRIHIHILSKVQV